MTTISPPGQNRPHPWESAYPDHVTWDAPLEAVALPDMFDEAVARFRDNPCTYFLGATKTYGEIGELTERVAAGLQAAGVVPGAKVGLFLPNCPYFIVFYFAVLKIGGVVVNYNPLYTVEELEHQVRDSDTRVMVTLDLKVVFDKVAELVRIGAVERVVACPFTELLPTVKSVLFRLLKGRDRAAPRSSAAAGALIDYHELANSNASYTQAKVDPIKTLALLQYTGGTTGTPKGAMLSHANLTVNVVQVTLLFPELNGGEEKVMAVLPFFHVFAMTSIMNFGLAQGVEMILMPKFELDEAVKLIRRKRPTILPGVPTLFNALMTYPGITPDDLGSIKYCISGGAPLPLEVKKGFEKAAGCRLVEGYGLSETSPVVTTNPLAGAVVENSIGQPVPGTIVSIRDIDDHSREMPQGESGEVCVWGPQVMSGYWNKPQETADTFTGEFFKTGDVGYMDEQGFIYLIDRLKDIIICSGFNVYPRRIEDAIYEHPAVDEVTVIGVPDEYRGEAPKAFIKLNPGAEATVEEILEFLSSKISAIEMPDHIEFRDELPKTLVGKLSKKELREAS